MGLPQGTAKSSLSCRPPGRCVHALKCAVSQDPKSHAEPKAACHIPMLLVRPLHVRPFPLVLTMRSPGSGRGII